MGTRRVLAIIATLSLAIGACSSSGASPSSASGPASPSAGAGTAVQVTLKEWAIATDVTTAPAGVVTFTAKNEGPKDVHEFVVIKTDLSLIDLPTDATGTVEEEAGGLTVSGEIEDVAVGSSGTVSLTLTPGAYVLICNVYDEADKESHYQQGMRASFTVQ